MKLDNNALLEIYKRMVSIRKFEEVATILYLDGQIPGACHSSIGHEAAIVGACMALRDDDYITGTHRSHGHPIGKGANLDVLMAELMGKANGICKGRGGSMHLADSSVGIVGESAIVGGGIPLATGCGLSAKVRKTDQVGLCFFGDGASNQGTFHESINMASVWKLPVIYFCENNHYAITTSVENSHGQPDIAKRAQGYGVPGITVDGQDVLAVYKVCKEAIERARRGDGPSIVEAKTYRFDEHQVGLNILGDPYRPLSEVENYINNRDPISQFRTFLLKKNFPEGDILDIEIIVTKNVENAVEFAKSSPLPNPDSLFDYMYCNAI